MAGRVFGARTSDGRIPCDDGAATPEPRIRGDTEESLFGAPREQLPPENDEGPVEYKLKLLDPDPERFDRLVSQLKFRLGEGLGEALYEVGVGDDGTPTGLPEAELEASLTTLRRMAAALGAEVTVLHARAGLRPESGCVEALVRERPLDGNLAVELRVAVVGNVDSGKSTLVGVLTRGQLDNGRGLARGHCFRHKHEVDNGRTSSVSQQVLGFCAEGQVTNYSAVRPHTQEEVLKASSKLVTFVDLCGHERYLKTTVFGLTGAVPDFGAIILGANMGVQRMTREHLGLLLALRLPFFVVVTKIDLAPENVRAETVDKMCSLLKGASVRKMPYLIKDATGCLSCARQLAEGARLVPVFQVSNVTGEGLDLLRLFLNALPARREWVGLRDEKAEFCIDDAFQARRPSGIECPSVLATCFKTTSPACCKSHRKRASPSCQRCSDDPARGRGSGPSEYPRGTPRRGRDPPSTAAPRQKNVAPAKTIANGLRLSEFGRRCRASA